MRQGEIGSSPRVRGTAARAIFHKEGKEIEWDNLLNAYLREEWEAIPTDG